MSMPSLSSKSLVLPLALLLIPAVGCGGKNESTTGAASASSGATSATSAGSGPGTTTSATSQGTAGATSTSGTSTSAGGDSSGSGGFIARPDGGVEGQCDPGLQDCPNEDEKCTGYVTMPGDCCVDANHCVPMMGVKQFGEPCTRVDGNDDCDKGLFCMTKTSGSTGDGICLEYCVVDDPGSCANGGSCLAFNDGALPLCEQECDPLLQDCQGSQGCYPAFDRFVCAVPNLDQGGGDGDPCYTIQSCQPGLACVNADALSDCGDTACCTPFCDLNDADPCTQPETCTSWFEMGMAPPGLENVGACLIPQ